MVTKEQLVQLRRERNQLSPRMDYTPNNSAYAGVVYTHDLKREQVIKAGERSMKNAQDKMRVNHAFSRLNGHAKAGFNHSTKKQEIKP